MPLGPDGTGYTAIARRDGTYEVEVIKPAEVPEVVGGFATEEEAENFILSKIGTKPLPDVPGIATIP